MKLFSAIVAMVFLTTALAGCNDAPAEEEVILPGSISKKQVDDLEELAAEQFPRAVEFPGQTGFVDPIVDVFSGVLSQGGGFGVEYPADGGPVEIGGEYISLDLASQHAISDYQPVEVRLKLKFWGDPGAASDMDIFVNVPGENDALDTTSYDESWNWNIVTKFRVVNTVKLPGEPLEIGVQVQNGKVLHPDGVRWEVQYEIHFPPNVLPPYVAHIITIPDDANILIVESEPVIGDEHVTSQLVLVDPQDNVIIDKWHNDIATETYSIPVRGGGEYVVYVKYQHGGFLRLETDVQNENWMARQLQTTVTEVSIGGAPAPAPSGYGSTGDFGVSEVVLDAYAYIRAAQPVAASASAVMAVINDNGDYHSITLTGQVAGPDARVGNDYVNSDDPESADSPTLAGGFTWGYTNNGAVGIDAGYGYVTYTR